MKLLQFTKCFSAIGLGLALLATTIKADEKRTLYTMDNAAAVNHILVFQQHQNGQIADAGMLATGGMGAGTGLSSQGSILLSHDRHWLFVCNAGSDEISVFAAGPERLQLVDKVNSGGHFPLSLTFQRNLLYVLNAGGTVGEQDNITAFLFAQGRLTPLPDSTRSLSADNTGPAQVSFTEDGNSLVVTERLTSLIDTFTLDDEGLVGAHQTFPSAGKTPFGFAVGPRNRIFVSEAAASSTSSYSLSDSGDLTVISSAVPTEQKAACWLTLSQNGRFAYTANAGSGTISRFGVGPDGTLRLLDPNGISAVTGTGSHPVDMAESGDGRFLFVLANGSGTVGAFHVAEDGSLRPLGFTGGVPTSAAGLAVR
jgi:6-phosphogluconolactonase (cycloisomerase 2 family)